MSDDKLEFGYGEQLAEAVRNIVCRRIAFDAVLHAANIPEPDQIEFSVALGDAVGNLDEHNCAEFGLSKAETRAWMQAGRPAGSEPSAPEPDSSEDPGAVISIRHAVRD
jgi:hypothetical protein